MEEILYFPDPWVVKQGFNEERVLSVWTGPEDQI